LLKLKDGAYVLAAGEKTKFSRMVFLRPVCKNKADCDGGVCDDGKSCASGQIGIAVEVQVGWSESGGAKTFSATEYLYNWR
jgi:hypothetical protein